jgi:hypothetical protein
MLGKVAGFIAGGTLSTGFVCVMDDTIYAQMRRNVILPMKQVLSTFTTRNEVDVDELISVGKGTANFVSQFKPHELGHNNVKALLLKDEDFATPQDHYFGYINRRQGETAQDDQKKQMDVIRSLGLEVMLPPTYNIDKGVFEEPKLLDSKGKDINYDEIDVFELAKLRGTNVTGLKELMNDRN